MSTEFRLSPNRPRDVAAILEMLAFGQSVALIGLSNFGKSTMLRQMVEARVVSAYQFMAGRPPLFVYVDCNRMLEMSAQGFYEVILRAILEALHNIEPARPVLVQTVSALYEKVVESRSSFAIPLGFNDAIIAVLEDEPFLDVILLIDEFDDVLTGLEERVFLNLRALKDKYGERLDYVIATLRPPSTMGGGDYLGEFLESFAAYRYHLKPLAPDEATEVASEIFVQANDSLDPPERDFILAQAGGHPGLIQAVAHVVLEVESGAPATYTQQALGVAGDVLQNHQLVRVELGKLWKQLLPSEREAAILVATRGVDALATNQRAQLLKRGVLVNGDEDSGENASTPRLFAELFEHYARRQALIQHSTPEGVWIDLDAGTVHVDNRMIEPLTDLEYRLLLLLYGRIDKICDKYQIVESVWGQEYLGEVDDARIEKLISRLRSKLEPDPASPEYISTVRGRGYKLNPPKGLPE